MNSFRYYAYNDDRENPFNLCSKSSDEFPIEVNCAGLMSLKQPFATYNECGRDDYYLMYIVEGELTFELGGSNEIGTVGDFVVFPPHYKYKYFSKTGQIAYYFVHFTGYAVSDLLSALGLNNEPEIKHGGINKGARDALSSMFDVWGCEDKYSARLRGSYFETTLISLASANESGEHRRIDTSLSYINAFYTSDISVPDLAAMENLSVSRYNTVFREIMGTSPTRYISDLRMNHACSLLGGTDIAIGIIGEMVGYPDKHFFSKTFKKHIGLSPLEYRNMWGSNAPYSK